MVASESLPVGEPNGLWENKCDLPLDKWRIEHSGGRKVVDERKEWAGEGSIREGARAFSGQASRGGKQVAVFFGERGGLMG